VTQSEYLAAEIETAVTVRVAQVSAPVFQADGQVGGTVMSLGPSYGATAGEITALGTHVAATAVQFAIMRRVFMETSRGNRTNRRRTHNQYGAGRRRIRSSAPACH
jgi:hypothetical protein